MSNEEFSLVDNSTATVDTPKKPVTNTTKRRKTRVESSRETTSGVWSKGKKYTASDTERQDWDLDLPDPGSLPNVEAIKEEGFTYRWIRTIKSGKSDDERVNHAIAEGWEPVWASDIPEGLVIPYLDVAGMGMAVGMSGMMLCRMPSSRHDQLKSNERQLAQSQIDNIGSEIREVNSGGDARPLKSLESTVLRGPQVQG